MMKEGGEKEAEEEMGEVQQIAKSSGEEYAMIIEQAEFFLEAKAKYQRLLQDRQLSKIVETIVEESSDQSSTNSHRKCDVVGYQQA